MAPPASLVLASRSPQRHALLQRLGVAFAVRPTDVPERDRGDPHEVALENALRKAHAATRHVSTETLLGVDTLVCLDDAIFGKPQDQARARSTLSALSGATHRVVSGLALLDRGHVATATAETRVTFRDLDDRTLAWYLATGEWRGRAGGYAIQGAGAALVRAIEGDYENVVGLPLATLLDMAPELLFSGAAAAS